MLQHLQETIAARFSKFCKRFSILGNQDMFLPHRLRQPSDKLQMHASKYSKQHNKLWHIKVSLKSGQSHFLSLSIVILYHFLSPIAEVTLLTICSTDVHTAFGIVSCLEDLLGGA